MKRILSGALVILAALSGCGDDDGGTDTGTVTDTGTATDTGAATDTGTPTDTGTAADSSVMFPDGGGGDPEWVDLTVGPVGTCTELVPCGGDIVGSWDLTGGCFEDDIDSTISACPGATVSSRTGRGRGRVVFGADGFAQRVAESEVMYTIDYPATCATFFSCEMLETAIAPYVDTVSCPGEPGGSCTCTASLRTVIDQADAYTTEMNQIVGVSSGKRWDYCVEGDALTYQDTDRTMSGEPGIIELGR